MTLKIDTQNNLYCSRLDWRRSRLVGRGKITFFSAYMYDIMLGLLDSEQDSRHLCDCLMILLGGCLLADVHLKGGYTGLRLSEREDCRVELSLDLMREAGTDWLPPLDWYVEFVRVLREMR